MLGTIYTVYEEMLEQTHLLVAGATGSGKSVVIDGIIHNGLYSNPDHFQLILVDPKKIELRKYRNLPHVIQYANEQETMIDALEKAVEIMDERFSEMGTNDETMYTGSDIWVIIDEWADLALTNKKRVFPLVQRLGQLGRAARIHVLLATQTPIAKVLPTEIKCNFDSRIGLRARSVQDSRNILDHSGLENLPRYGKAIFKTPENEKEITVDMYAKEEHKELIEYWMSQMEIQKTA